VLTILGLLIVLPVSFGDLDVGPVTLSLNWQFLGLAILVVGLQGFFLGCIAQVLFDYTGRNTRRWMRVFPYTRTTLIALGLVVLGVCLALPLVFSYLDHDFRLSAAESGKNHLALTGLAAVIAGFHQQFPGAALAFTSGVDEHHGRIRFGWKMTGGPQPLDGIDVGRLAGDPLDLYVMTHEHLDHVQGLFYAHETLNKSIQVKQAWLTGSANPDYYKTHPEARKQKIAALAAYQVTSARLQATVERSPLVDALLATNDPSKTSNCVAYLRTLVTPANLHYVDRTTDLNALQPATSATISLWAPEEDTADYYGTFKPLAAALQIGDDTSYDDLGLDDTPVNP